MLLLQNHVKCLDILRADSATTWPVMASVNAEKISDWTISSQASWKQVEGSTTRKSNLNSIEKEEIPTSAWVFACNTQK